MEFDPLTPTVRLIIDIVRNAPEGSDVEQRVLSTVRAAITERTKRHGDMLKLIREAVEQSSPVGTLPSGEQHETIEEETAALVRAISVRKEKGPATP
jgi:hypothetical protein